MSVLKECGILFTLLAVPAAVFAGKAEIYRKTGGMIECPGSAKGTILIINSQKRLSVQWLENAAKFMDRKYRFKFRIVEVGQPVSLSGAKEELKKYNASHGIVISALDAKLPSLIALPDDGCAVINATVMPEDEGAVMKQVSRAFALACGGCGSQYPGSLMGPFANVKQLSAYPEMGLPVDVVARVKNTLKDDGILPYIMASYKSACREGWAPEPGTNEVWKAIWSAAKSEKERGPTNPIEIKPPKK